MVENLLSERLVLEFCDDHPQEHLDHFQRNKETLMFLGHLNNDYRPGKDVAHHDAAVELLETLGL